MNFLELGLYITTVIIMIASPGPVMILVASTGLKESYKATFKTILGTNLASLVLITLSILVLKGIFSINEEIYLAIRVIGCLYIGYLGYEILKEHWGKHKETLQPLTATVGGFKKGLFIGLSNPKDIIFFTSFFPQFTNVHSDINVSLAILIITWIILDFSVLSIIYKVFNTLAKSRIYPIIMSLCGVLILLIALYGLTIAVGCFLA